MMLIRRLCLVSCLIVASASAFKDGGDESEADDDNDVDLTLRLFRLGGGLPRNNSCTSMKDSCAECISKPECAWCLDPVTKEEAIPNRCDLRSWFEESPSRCGTLEDPDNVIDILKENPLTTDGSEDKFVQITPQRVRMRLRRGQEARLKFRVAQAKQYPVDLYYLMDLSNSMSDDRKNIVKLGDQLARAIRNITADFRIGFGSFVDKEVMPFISLVPGKNCQQDDGCPRPYSFQHQMRLGTDAGLFQQKVEEAPISGNIDNPEGGFDGLVQVMVCEHKIGWREEARRVIIYTSDQSFHIAMDGKLGGLIKPNDGKCHLNSSGFYTHSTIQDYPSIGQISHIAREKNVNIIWAVTLDKFDLYNTLTEIVDGSTAGVISNDSSNVVQLVRRQYEAITTTIRVQENSTPNCETKITSECGKSKGPECKNVELGTPVEFTLHVKLKECVPETFSVSPVGISGEMVVEVEPICECPCKLDPVMDHLHCNDSLACSGNGHLMCGECQCCGNYFGPDCSCSVLGTGVDPDDLEASCRRPDLTNSNAAVCSGRGICECGICSCKKFRPGLIVSGKYCQEVCDNTACDIGPNKKRCSGHGKCVCGDCDCTPPWTGSDCSCRKSPGDCISPQSPGRECSGHGTCPCDRCICSDEGYTGQYCEVCETCQGTCAELRKCAECHFFEDGELMEPGWETEEELEQLKENCTKVCPNMAKDYPDEIPTEWPNCTFHHGSCNYTFSYNSANEDVDINTLVLHLTPYGELERCPPPPDFVGIIFGIVGAIVCVGLLTLFLWKAFTTIHDRREFAKFEAERARMRFPAHYNPIFRQATTTVQNPIFNSPHHF